MRRLFVFLLTISLLLVVPTNKIQADEVSAWTNLGRALSGNNNFSENGFIVVDNGKIRTVTLIENITAAENDDSLYIGSASGSGFNEIVLDLNGHVLNRNVVKSDGSINRNVIGFSHPYSRGAAINVACMSSATTIIDSKPTEPHEGFIGSDYLWHIGKGDGEPLTIYGGIITGGCGDGKAGGICNQYGVLTMTGGTVCGNTGFNTSGSGASGGGIYTVNNDTFLSNITVCYNTALSETEGSSYPRGAGIYHSPYSDNTTKFELTNVIIHHNYLIGSSGDGQGAGLYSGYGKKVTINGGEIYDNSVIIKNSGDFSAAGGGLYLTNANGGEGVSISGCEIHDNEASSGAGAYITSTNKVTMDNMLIKDNEVIESPNNYGGAGGICIYSVSDFSMTESTIDSNSGVSGGGMKIDYCDSVYIEDVSITNNKSIGPEGEEGDGTGAGVYMARSSVEMKDVDIENNEASGYGAGVYIEYTDDTSSFTVGGHTVINNNKTNGTNDNADQSNVFLADLEYNKTLITISEENPLDDTSRIGVTVKIDKNKDWGPGVDITKLFEGLTDENKSIFFLVNCSSKNKHHNIPYEIEKNGESFVIPGEPEIYTNPDWVSLSNLMDGKSIKDSSKYEVSDEGNTRTIKLLSDFEATVSDLPLQCTNPNMNIILDLNGHVLNRKIVASDGTITWFDENAGEDAIGYVIEVRTSTLTIKDSNPTEPHEGFIGSDYLWHIGEGDGEPLTICGGIITGGCGNEYAGGINVHGGTLTINGGNICGNTSSNEDEAWASGGGLYASYYYDYETSSEYVSSITINGGSICYNTALGNGIQEFDPIIPDPKPIIDPVIIKTKLDSKDNEPVLSGSISSNPSGGGIYQSGGSLTINGGTINNNTLVVGNNGWGSGSGIYFQGAEFNMDGGTIANNSIVPLGESFDVSGGGIYFGFSRSLNPFVIKNAIITNNEATYGGGVYVDSCSVTIEDSIISNNEAINASSYPEYPSGLGGGIYACRESVVTLLGGKIVNNTAGYLAGGVFVSNEIRRQTPRGEMVEEGTTCIVGNDLVVKNNVVSGEGGIDEDNIYLEDSGPVVYVSPNAELKEQAEIGVTVDYSDELDWQPGTNVEKIFNSLNESNKDCFFMTNSGSGNSYKGKVFGIIKNENGYVLDGMYKVVVDSNTQEGTVVPERSYYLDGKAVNVVVTPNEGYELVSLTYNDGTDHDITTAKSFIMPKSDVKVKAVFKQASLPPQTVSVNKAENGKVEVKQNSFVPGETVTVTVSPDEGYRLASLIYNDGENHDITATKSFVMPNAEVTITATFEKIVTPTPTPTPTPSPDSGTGYKMVRTGIK